MEDVIRRFNEGAIRYLLIGGQAMRLFGLPRFSLDWDVLVPPRDVANLDRITQILGDEVDLPLVPLGARGENLIQTYQTRWGVLQFHLGVPGLPDFDQVAARAVVRRTENGVPVRCLGPADLLASKRQANRPEDQQDIAFLEKQREAGLW